MFSGADMDITRGGSIMTMSADWNAVAITGDGRGLRQTDPWNTTGIGGGESNMQRKGEWDTREGVDPSGIVMIAGSGRSSKMISGGHMDVITKEESSMTMKGEWNAVGTTGEGRDMRAKGEPFMIMASGGIDWRHLCILSFLFGAVRN
jgi:hypothetical protein